MKAWEQQNNESDAQYRAFTCYLNLKPPRTYAQAYRDYGGRSKNRVTPNFLQWAERHNWKERAKVFDAENTKKLEKVTSEMHEQFIREAFAIQHAALRNAYKRLTDKETKFTDIVQFLKWSVEITGTSSVTEIAGLHQLQEQLNPGKKA